MSRCAGGTSCSVQVRCINLAARQNEEETMSKTLIAAALTAALLTGTATAQSHGTGPTPGPHSGEQADIPFATHDGIRTFTADQNGEGVFLQDNRRNWYYARFFARCLNIDFSLGIGYRTFAGSPNLSRGDTIYAGHEACRIADLVRSGPPPEKPKKVKHPHH
jgi:hypothetical protein